MDGLEKHRYPVSPSTGAVRSGSTGKWVASHTKPGNSWRTGGWHEALESEHGRYFTGARDKVKYNYSHFLRKNCKKAA
jgi:hypothetical protein